MLGESFRKASDQMLSDSELVAVRARLNRGRKQLISLQMAADEWFKNSGIQFTQELGTFNDEILIFAHLEKKIPYLNWSSAFGESLHNVRSALDQMNDLLNSKFQSGEESAKRTYFPLASTGKDWRSWKQQHKHYPKAVIDRYSLIQPYESTFKGLGHLADLNNADKHRRSPEVTLGIEGAISEGELTFDGIHAIDHLDVTITTGQNLIGQNSKTFQVASFRYGVPIISFTSAEVDSNRAMLNFHLDGEIFHFNQILAMVDKARFAMEYVVSGDERVLARYSQPIGDLKVLEEIHETVAEIMERDS